MNLGQRSKKVKVTQGHNSEINLLFYICMAKVRETRRIMKPILLPRQWNRLDRSAAAAVESLKLFYCRGSGIVEIVLLPVAVESLKAAVEIESGSRKKSGSRKTCRPFLCLHDTDLVKMSYYHLKSTFYLHDVTFRILSGGLVINMVAPLSIFFRQKGMRVNGVKIYSHPLDPWTTSSHSRPPTHT